MASNPKLDSGKEMFISEDELLKRLRSKYNGVHEREKTVTIIPEGTKKIDWEINRGRNKGDTNLDPLSREVIGTMAAIDGPSEAARVFGVSRGQAHNIREAIISNYVPAGSGERVQTKDPILETKITQNVAKIREDAAEIVMQSLGLIKPMLTGIQEPLKLAKIAKDIAVVSDAFTPKEQAPDKAPSQVIIYAPAVQPSSGRYEAIDVKPEKR